MAAAFVSIGVMIYVLVVFGLRGDNAPAPTTPAGSQPHAKAAHHTAEPHEGGKPAPIQVFAGSVVGEWIAFESIKQLAGSAPKPIANVIEVEAVDDKQVTLVHSLRENRINAATNDRVSLPRQGLTLDQLIGNDAALWTIYGVTISDDVHEVDGRAFKCKKLSFSMQNPVDLAHGAKVEAWISEEVPAGGLVELRQLFPETRLESTQRLIGFGTAAAITWGKKPDGLDAVRDAEGR